ncbi:MAG TPA: hypothetical protein VI136_02150 [Verrucomicrobiae bacterium]
MRALLHPEADEEFAEAVRYYSEISPELGVRFYREIESVTPRGGRRSPTIP